MFKKTCFNDTLNFWGKDYKSQVTGHHMKCLSLHWLQIFKSSQAQQPFLKPEIPKCLNLTYSRGIAPSPEPCLDAHAPRPCRKSNLSPKGGQ